MKTAIITGAGGFIGGAMTTFLLDKGIKVYGVDISERTLARHMGREGFIPVIAEFADYPRLHEKIYDDVDVFYHFAWQGYGKDTQNFDVQVNNVIATEKVCEAAGKIGCRKFVLACSSYEYQKNEIDSKMGLCSIYGAAKAASKSFAQVVSHRAGMLFCGALFTNVFGVGDQSNRSTNTIIRKLLRGEDIDATKGEDLYDWSYIDDVVGGLYAVGEKGLDGKEYYVGSNRLRPLKDIITEVRDIVSPKSVIHFGAFENNAYVDYANIDVYQLYNDTGYYPTAEFKESILKTAIWLQSQTSGNGNKSHGGGVNT